MIHHHGRAWWCAAVFAALGTLTAGCKAPTGLEESLSGGLQVSPAIVKPPVPVSVLMTVTNRSDRDLYLGGATSCLLSFEVLDAAGMSVGAPPLLIRFCSTVVTNLRLAPGNSYEELAGWNGFVGASRFEELPDGEYQLRLWVRASYRRWHGGWRPAELAGLPMVTVEVEAN